MDRLEQEKRTRLTTKKDNSKQLQCQAHTPRKPGFQCRHRELMRSKVAVVVSAGLLDVQKGFVASGAVHDEVKQSMDGSIRKMPLQSIPVQTPESSSGPRSTGAGWPLWYALLTSGAALVCMCPRGHLGRPAGADLGFGLPAKAAYCPAAAVAGPRTPPGHFNIPSQHTWALTCLATNCIFGIYP